MSWLCLFRALRAVWGLCQQNGGGAVHPSALAQGITQNPALQSSRGSRLSSLHQPHLSNLMTILKDRSCHRPHFTKKRCSGSKRAEPVWQLIGIGIYNPTHPPSLGGAGDRAHLRHQWPTPVHPRDETPDETWNIKARGLPGWWLCTGMPWCHWDRNFCTCHPALPPHPHPDLAALYISSFGCSLSFLFFFFSNSLFSFLPFQAGKCHSKPHHLVIQNSMGALAQGVFFSRPSPYF